MRKNEAVFVDTGAWVALALSRDPFHARAREVWDSLLAAGARLHTSVPVILENLLFSAAVTVPARSVKSNPPAGHIELAVW